MYRCILFDLDGTLVDSSAVIFCCIDHALSAIGAPPLPPEKKALFIGPPLTESFARHCGFTPAQVSDAIEHFQQKYASIEDHTPAVIAGIPQALHRLHAAGLTMAVTSAKLQRVCRDDLTRLGIAPLFDGIFGSLTNLEENSKEKSIRRAMAHLGITENNVQHVLLVGDRKYDVFGAKKFGIPCLGVDFCGFAPKGELEEAGAIAVVKTPDEMADFILKYPIGSA